MLLAEGLKGSSIFIGYYLILASLLVVIRSYSNIKQELFRKILHLVCFMSILVLLYAFETWHLAALVALGFAIVVYPAIAFIERYPKLMAIFNERHNGEIKSSLMLVFFMMASLIAVFWGWQGEEWKFIIVIAVLAWGFGDAAAALVGKSYGKRKISHPWVDNKKTVEGTLAMFFTACFTVMVTLMIYTQLPWYICLIIGVVIAPTSALVELVSHRGVDTITVPYATAIALFGLLQFI